MGDRVIGGLPRVLVFADHRSPIADWQRRRPLAFSLRQSMGKTESLEPLPGTLDLLILKTLAAGPHHGYGIAQRLKLLSDDVVRVGESSLYRRCSGCSSEVGRKPNGARPKTTGAPTTRSRPRAGSSSRPSATTGADDR
jgi:hypothetical protein